MFLEKRNGGTEMLECEIEIGKEERDALLEIALNSKEYRKKRKVEAIKFSILIVACILIIIWRVTNSDTRLVVLCSLLAALNYCVYFLNFILFSDILFPISAQKKSYETDFSPATQLFLKYLSSIIVDQASLADDFSLIIGQRA